MKNLVFEKERTVSSAFIDSTTRLGIAQAVLMVQDNLTECFSMLGCDGIVYREKYNCFWVFTKTRIHFFSRPEWRQKIRAVTFPVDNAGMRTHVNSALYNMEGNLLVSANQEACVLSLENRRPVKLDSLDFPAEGFPEPVFDSPFERLTSSSDGMTKVYEQTVRSQLIDMSRHMNNIEYIKLALNTFSDDFLQTHEPQDMEVHYTGESRENQILEVYRRDEKEACIISIREKECGKAVFEMKISFRDSE